MTAFSDSPPPVMADSIDTYIVSDIFLFFISRYRKNLSGIFQGIPLSKVQPLILSRRGWKTGRSSFPDKELSGHGKPPPAIGCSNVSISPN